jgi:hypothetical protein
MILSDETIAQLKQTARKSTYEDNAEEDDIIYDWCGGNVDDAFEMGITQGEVDMARMILSELNISWTE